MRRFVRYVAVAAAALLVGAFAGCAQPGTGTIRTAVGTTSQTTPVTSDADPASFTVTTGPAVQLAAGLNTIEITSTSGSWNLDWFSRRRL